MHINTDDGKLLDIKVIPGKKIQLQPGDYFLTVRKDGYEKYEKYFTIKDADTTIHVTLKPPMGCLVVTTNVKNAIFNASRQNVKKSIRILKGMSAAFKRRARSMR